MRKVVTGEQVAQLTNPDPFAVPVLRAPVYRTPGWIIAVVQLGRLLWWLARLTPGTRSPTRCWPCWYWSG